jgi:uncharacterized ion transporter superfamily protein YfcC
MVHLVTFIHSYVLGCAHGSCVYWNSGYLVQVLMVCWTPLHTYSKHIIALLVQLAYVAADIVRTSVLQTCMCRVQWLPRW